MPAANSATSDPLPDDLRACILALLDRQAENLKILDLREKNMLVDYMVVANGNSSPHLRALSLAVEKALGLKEGRLGKQEAEFGSGWVVVDAGDFVVHLFTEELRKFYSIEALWKDAPVLNFESELS